VCVCDTFDMLGAAEHAADWMVSRREARSEKTPHQMTGQKRDTPRKRSEPTPSSHRSPRTTPASVSCPAGFTIHAEPDPVSVVLSPNAAARGRICT